MYMYICICTRQSKHNIFYVDRHINPNSMAVVQTRARHLGVETVVDDFHNFDFSSGNVCGVLVQYPNTDGQINDFEEMIEKAHDNKVRERGKWGWREGGRGGGGERKEGGRVCVCVCDTSLSVGHKSGDSIQFHINTTSFSP